MTQQYWGYSQSYTKISRPQASKVNGKDPCLVSSFLSTKQANVFFVSLKKNIPWTKNPKWSYGYALPQNAFYYDENIRANKSKQINVLEKLCKMIENSFKCNVFTVWCNLFEDNSNYIDWHQDQYGYDCFTLSFGITRQFLMRNKKSKKIIANYELKHGDLYFFSQDADKINEHCVPKVQNKNKQNKNIKNTKDEIRVSILFFIDYPKSREYGYNWDPLKCKYV